MNQTVFNRKCKGSLTEKDDSTTEIVIQGEYQVLLLNHSGIFHYLNIITVEQLP